MSHGLLVLARDNDILQVFGQAFFRFSDYLGVKLARCLDVICSVAGAVLTRCDNSQKL